MAISLSIDNDRGTAGTQNLTLDQTAGTQAPPDGNDVNLTLFNSQIDGFGPTAGALDAGFETYLSTLGLGVEAKDFAVLVDGSSSSSTFIQATATAGENFTDLRFNDPGASNLITGLQTLAGEPLYLHVDATGNYATVTTASGAGGRVVAAFALTNEVLNNVTHIATAGVQMVTLEPIKQTVTTNNDENLSFTDILQIGASATRSFDFDALQSGASLWCAVGNSSGAVLITGRDAEVDDANKKTNDSDVIHTSQGGDGTTVGVDNQLFDIPGETAVITLVTGFTNLVGADAGATGVYTVDAKPNDPKPEGIDYSGYLNVTGAAVYLSQSQGNDPKDLDIVLWEAGGDAGGAQTAEDLTNYIPGLVSDTAVNVASVTIRDDDGNVVGVWGLGGTLTSGQSVNGWDSTNGLANVTVTITGNTIQVEGVLGEYTVSWTSAAGETFNRFDVVGQGGQFDIGQVDITESLSSGVGLGSHLFVDDDGPSVDLVLNGMAELRLDETDNDSDDNDAGGILATNTLAAAAYLTTDTANFGTDGQAASNPTVWSLTLAGANAAGVDSGLDDAATNSNVMLFLTNSTTIVGRVGGAAGAVVMTISINATTGALTVTQNRAVEHNDSADHDEAGTSSAMMNSGLISAVRSITDGDGDSTSDNVDISQVIKLEDDGPSVDLVLDGMAELRLDETDNDADDNNVGGILATNTLAAAAYLTTNSANFGSDGQASANPTVWALTLAGANAAGVDSGLDDAATNSNVMLFLTNSTTIVGRVGGPAGAVVMTISINATTGALTVTQERAVEHNDSGDHDEAGASSAVMNSGLISAVRTITDGDGDSATDNVDVSQVIKLEDDGPSVDLTLNGSAELRLDETDNDADDNAVGGILATNTLATASYLTSNTASFGSDGAATSNSSVWSLTLTGANAAGVDSGLDDAVTNSNVMLFQTNSTTIVGRVGGPAGAVVMTISINTTTGALTVTQDRAVEHNDSADHDEAGASSAMMNSGLVNAVRTVTDGDGDSASDSADVSQVIKLEDDGPSVDITLNTSAELRLDETDNDADDNAVGGILAAGSIAVGSYLSIDTASFGSDGQAAANPTAWSLSLTGANAAGVDSGLDDAITNSNVMLFQTNATTIVGRVGGAAGAVVMTVTINASTGELSVTQERGIEHNDSADPDEAGTSSAVMNTGLIGAVRTVTDGDGDSASDSADVSRVIKLEDDGPGITGQPMGSATPNNLVVANTVGATDGSAYTLAGGADGAASFNFVGPADGSGDFTWAFFNVDGMNGIEQNEIRGFYKGNALYDLELNPDGTYTVTMLGTLPGSSLNLSTAEIKAGAPDTNSIEVGAAENDQFVRISGESTVGAGNINESNAFVGVDNGNLDANETLIFTLHNEDGTAVNFTGMSIGTKSAQASDYSIVAHLVGGETYEIILTVPKNGTLVIDPPGNMLVSSIEVTKVTGSATKIGIGDIDIFTLPSDVTLGFDVRLTDGDGDFVGQSFTLSIDGDNDGAITNPVQGLAALNTSYDAASILDSTSVVGMKHEVQTFPHHSDYYFV